jgi:multimeric flavodoxin WrbA
MNIVAILGSPHGLEGNTGTLLAQVTQAAEQAGAHVQTLSLSEHAVHACIACDTCHKAGRCPGQDQMREIRRAMEQADGIILASPVYLFSVTAQMKAVLDRSCGAVHCQAMRGKYGAAVVTAGGAGSAEVEEYLLRALRALGCWTVGSVGAPAQELHDPGRREAHFAAAAQLGARLTHAIRERVIPPDQVENRTRFLQWMRELVTSQKEAWPYEYEYWRTHG